MRLSLSLKNDAAFSRQTTQHCQIGQLPCTNLAKESAKIALFFHFQVPPGTVALMESMDCLKAAGAVVGPLPLHTLCCRHLPAVFNNYLGQKKQPDDGHTGYNEDNTFLTFRSLADFIGLAGHRACDGAICLQALFTFSLYFILLIKSLPV